MRKGESLRMEHFERAINYSFNDKSLLRTSFTHSSYAYERGALSNERLEFLGDAVLEMITSDYLYRKFGDMPEGDLTKLRAAAVCEPSLARVARGIGLERYLRLGKGEESTGGRNRDSLLSDAMEAVIGAVYLDGGPECARGLVISLLAGYIDELSETKSFGDHKTMLQEVIQRKSGVPVKYCIVDEHGPAHQKSFVAEVSHENTVLGRGSGKSKMEAEQQAALAALRRLRA